MKKALLLSITFVLSAMFFVTGIDAKEVKVKGYTKKDGTKVEGYTKTIKDKTNNTPDKEKVSGYTKKDGTKVKGYMRTKSTK